MIDEFDDFPSDEDIQAEIIKKQEQFIKPYLEKQDDLIMRSFDEDVTNPD